MEYEQAGAVVTEDLSPASFLIGVKTVKPEKLVENKSYMFFSHTIKAQPGSMKLLDTILEKKVRLYDYEAITVGGRDDAPRAVAFGGYAGRAGMIDGLQGLGLRLLAEGYSTPFLHLPTTYMHQNWEQAQHAIRSMGKLITSAGLPAELSPLVIAFTGNGNVSKGAREVFELLPHEYIKVEELATITEQIKAGKRSANKLYGVVVEKKDLVQLKTASSGPFDGADYYRNPSNYESIFHRTVLPHVQMLVNGIYWDSRFPRLVTKEQIKKLRSEGNRQLRVVADISCDIDGSCEFLTRPSTIEDPYYTYDPETNEQHSEIDHSGILMLAVDNLPSELPRDASEHFGAALLPLIPPILASKGDNTLSDLPAELKRACLFSNGEYMPKWSYIARLREQSDAVHGHHHAVDANAKSLATMKIELVGHLFDTGLINQVLDLLEHDEQVEYTITNCDVRPNNTSGAQYSRVQLELKGNDLNRVGAMADTITAAVSKTPRAEGTVNITDKVCFMH
jgi:alpha-aminoadipic semialdehyde synthase